MLHTQEAGMSQRNISSGGLKSLHLQVISALRLLLLRFWLSGPGCVWDQLFVTRLSSAASHGNIDLEMTAWSSAALCHRRQPKGPMGKCLETQVVCKSPVNLCPRVSRYRSCCAAGSFTFLSFLIKGKLPLCMLSVLICHSLRLICLLFFYFCPRFHGWYPPIFLLCLSSVCRSFRCRR